MKRAVAKAVEKRLDYGRLIESIAQLHDRAQSSAAAAVNRYLVLRNWLTGAYIVEFEQRGTDRARYDQRLLDRLSADLVRRGIRGLSATNLRQSRQFYRLYPNIRQTLSDESQQLRSQIHHGKVSDALGASQKKNFIMNLLQEMRREGTIACSKGSRGKGTVWALHKHTPRPKGQA